MGYPRDLRDLQGDVAHWLRANIERTGGDEPDPMSQFLVVAEEVGEVARAIVKEAQGHRKASRGDVAMEMGDVVIALCSLATALELDLQTCAETRWRVVGKRVWRRDDD